MKLTDRYIGRQILGGTLFAVLVLTLILVLGQLFKQVRPLLVESRAPLSVIGTLVLQTLPFSLVFTLPWGFLVAVLLAFGRLSGDNEILSLRAAGQSLPRVAAPALVLGALFSALVFWIAGTIAPRAKDEMKELLYNAFKDNPRALLDPGIVQSKFKGQKVYVEKRGDDLLHGLHIYQLDGKGRDARPALYLHAGDVGLRIDQEKKLLRLRLVDVFLEEIKPDGTFQSVAAEDMEPWFLDFSGAPRKNPKPNRMDNAEIRSALADPATPPERALACHAELSKRWSLSLACLAFAFVGVPLALQGQRQESSSGIVWSILIAGLYFGLLLTLQQVDGIPPLLSRLLILLPPVLCIPLGLHLFHRASRR